MRVVGELLKLLAPKNDFSIVIEDLLDFVGVYSRFSSISGLSGLVSSIFCWPGVPAMQ